MEKYLVYRRDELRENCNCGFCINRKGFKNTLKTWHTSRELFVDNLKSALEYVNGDFKKYIIFKSEYAFNFEQIKDYEEITSALAGN